MKKCLLKTLKAFVLICIALLLIYAFRSQLLTGLAKVLIVNDHLQSADIIFVLTGDVDSRPFYASELFNRGLASHIVIAKEEDSMAVEIGLFPNATDVAVKVMKERGVPSGNITVLTVDGGVTSTHEEALLLRRYVEDHAIGRVILVTSAFHTRRTKWKFEKELSNLPVIVEIAAAPNRHFDETNWWKTERGLIAVANEYLKLCYYFVVYR